MHAGLSVRQSFPEYPQKRARGLLNSLPTPLRMTMRLPIGADLGEGVDQLGLDDRSPAQRRAVGVQGHLQDAVPAFEPDFRVLARMLVKARQCGPSVGCAQIWAARECG